MNKSVAYHFSLLCNHQKILFHSTRKFPEIPMRVFSKMESTPCYFWQDKPLVITEGFIPLLNWCSSLLPGVKPWVTNLILDMAKLQTCWNSAMIHFSGKNVWTLCLLNQCFSINCLLLNIKDHKTFYSVHNRILTFCFLNYFLLGKKSCLYM